MAITVDDIRGVFGILPTPATPDADKWSTENSVSLDQTAQMVREVRREGCQNFLTNGTFGEGATLTWPEHQAFTDCVLQTMGGAGRLFAGVTTLNTRETIFRARGLIALGAHGLFLGRPMWLAMDDVEIVRYYADIAEALPGVPLIVYDNPLAFKGKISTAAYAELSRNRSIVAAKHTGGPALIEDAKAVEGRMRLLPIETHWYDFARQFPDIGIACWSGSIACAPQPVLGLADAIARQDWVAAQHLSERMKWAEAPMFPDGSLEKFMNYSIPIAHARFTSAGLFDPGPSRPPYIHAPESYLEGGRECGRRWNVVRDELQAHRAAA